MLVELTVPELMVVGTCFLDVFLSSFCFETKSEMIVKMCMFIGVGEMLHVKGIKIIITIIIKYVALKVRSLTF